MRRNRRVTNCGGRAAALSCVLTRRLGRRAGPRQLLVEVRLHLAIVAPKGSLLPAPLLEPECLLEDSCDSREVLSAHPMGKRKRQEQVLAVPSLYEKITRTRCNDSYAR